MKYTAGKKLTFPKGHFLNAANYHGQRCAIRKTEMVGDKTDQDRKLYRLSQPSMSVAPNDLTKRQHYVVLPSS